MDDDRRSYEEAGRESEGAISFSATPRDGFPATRQAALERIAGMDPDAYERTRNHVDGAVTRLGPYVTHGFTNVPEIVAAIRERGYPPQTKLVFELAWREFFHHAWRHLGDGILADLRPPVWPGRYAAELPRDLVEGRTGVRVIDASVRTLYRAGYLHNHARMWIASYATHVRKTSWRAGADWMYGQLLDGDLASNHLSWQWVAGTFSTKPYVFNAENVARYAPDLRSPDTAIDAPYDELDALARSAGDAGAEPGTFDAVAPPPVFATPPKELLESAGLKPTTKLGRRAGRSVALVHPWALGSRPDADLVIGVLHAPFHARFPWSTRRWAFVLGGLRNACDSLWIGDLAAFADDLRSAASVSVTATLNPGYREAFARLPAVVAPAPRFFADPATLCPSFTRFWAQVSIEAWPARSALRDRAA
jgi:deoxyribodipyrimidine photo-lyase